MTLAMLPSSTLGLEERCQQHKSLQIKHKTQPWTESAIALGFTLNAVFLTYPEQMCTIDQLILAINQSRKPINGG